VHAKLIGPLQADSNCTTKKPEKNGATPSGRQPVENPIKIVERPIKIRMIREKNMQVVNGGLRKLEIWARQRK